jgi:hypothetical protein
MMKFGCALICGIALGAAAFWYFTVGRYSTQTGGTSSAGAPSHSAPVIPGLDRFSTEEIKAELEKTGSIVREKARQAGASLSDAAANVRITATIKAKFLKDSELPSFQIGVDTTDGVVTLSGKVTSVDAVSRAVRLAFEVEGVTKVYSTIQVAAQDKR